MISNETPYRIIMYRSGMMQLKHNCTITYSPMTFMIFATQTKCKKNFSCRRWQQISITLQPLHTELQCPMRYSSRTIWIFHNYLINNDKIRIHCDLLPVSRELCILAKNVLATYTETATSSASESDRANNSDFITIRFVDISSFSDYTGYVGWKSRGVYHSHCDKYVDERTECRWTVKRYVYIHRHRPTSRRQ